MQSSVGYEMVAEVSIEDSNWLAGLAGLAVVESVTPMDGGWDNSNTLLILSDGTRFVLKIWYAQDELGVQTVIQQQLHLQQHGIPTSVPIQFNDGSRYIMRGGFAWTLLPFVEGGMLGTDRGALESLGETIAKMQEVPLDDCFPRDYRMGWSMFEKMFEESGPVSQWHEFMVLLKDEVDQLRTEIPDDLPEGILHGDLFPDNVLGGSKVAAIIDFEETWIGPRIFDLAMAFVGFGWLEGVPMQNRWEALLAGYESVNRLSDVERAAMPAMHRYATLSIGAWRYWKHVMREPDVEFADRYLEMVDRLEIQFDFSEAVQ